MRITLRTFGALAVQRDGETLPWLPAHRMRWALLTYLALERETTRDALVALLWAERDPERARHSLSQLLYELRQDLGEGCIDTRGEIVCATAMLGSDAADFQADVEMGELRRALRRYRGVFLAGTALHESAGFEAWIETQRVHFARLHRQARHALVERLLAAGDIESALGVAREWVGLDPLDDEAQHRTIELLCMAGERSEAVQRYEAYQHALAAQHLEPLESTRALIARVRAGEEPPPLRAPAAPVGESAPAAAMGRTGAAQIEEARAPASDALPAGVGAFLAELKRRQVFRVAVGYAMVAFVATEGADLLAPALQLPEWTVTMVVALALLGFLPALYLAWVFDITPQGVRRTDASRAGRSWAWVFALLGLAVAATLWLASGRDDARAAAAAAGDPARLAILPFEDHSPPPGMATLARAFTEHLLQRMGVVEGLTVLPLSAVRRFQDSDAPLDSIARALGAGTLVTGSFVGTDSVVEMRLELVDPLTTRSLVPLRLRSDQRDELALLDELSGEAANFVRIHMGERLELERRRRQTSSPEAWRLVRAADEARAEARGLTAYGDSAAGEAAHRTLLRADSLLEQAARLDPSWKEPPLLRGWVAAEAARLVELTTEPVDGELYVERARAGLGHAAMLLERDSLDAEALELRGTLRYRMGRRQGDARGEALMGLAERDLTRAGNIDGSRARAWQTLSELYQLRGQHAEARLSAEKALAADAFLEQADDVIYRLFTSALYVEDHADAIARCREGQRRFPHAPAFLMCELILRAFTEALPAELDTAWHLVWRERSLRPPKILAERVPRQKMEMAGIAARAGLADSARALIRQGRLDAVGQGSVQIRLNYYEALVRLRLGETAAARDLLRKLMAEVPSAQATLARDPFLAPLRADSAFDAMHPDR
ncbi:MAG TPA: BTAD domain-containing putative transcriptional regulator [Longimicrobiales bacterium]|nr:BTAD domain-containing putative transcriptional regulator [Longimicrobiales bacterium]